MDRPSPTCNLCGVYGCITYIHQFTVPDLGNDTMTVCKPCADYVTNIVETNDPEANF